MSEVFAIVLAAGLGKRMKSNTPKVAHMLHKKPLLQWAIDSVLEAGIKHVMVVISENPILKEIIQKNYPASQVRYCYQKTPLGTAHAVQCGLEALTDSEMRKNFKQNNEDNQLAPRPWDESDKILIAYGDAPGIKSTTYKNLIQFHEQQKNTITIAAFYAKNPSGYGRIVLNEHGDFVEICEEKDCSPEERKINLCHSGVMCANFDVLNELLPKIHNKNQAIEFYLTDIISAAKNLGYKVGFIASNHENEFMGVNTPEQLQFLEASLCAE